MPEESRYVIALVVPDPFSSEMVDFTKGVFDKFQIEIEIKSPPHISLNKPFFMSETELAQMKKQLSTFKYDNAFFDLTIKKFDYDEHGQIVVGTATNKKLTALRKEVSDYLGQTMAWDKSDHLSNGYHPQVMLGSKEIKKYLYSDARKYFTSHKYKATYKVMDLCLLKHNGEYWEEEMYF